MIIAFDFDKTLDDARLQRLAIKMRRERNEIWIVTARKDNDYNKSILKPTLDKLGLTVYNVIFCDEKPKWELIRGINADLYIDNISDEFEDLATKTKTIPLLWTS